MVCCSTITLDVQWEMVLPAPVLQVRDLSPVGSVIMVGCQSHSFMTTLESVVASHLWVWREYGNGLSTKPWGVLKLLVVCQ